MSIVVSIIKLPNDAVDTKSTHTFAHQGGTIGRGSDNAWILEDPERFISSQHSEISFENGQYYITDLSTNGTFSNGAAEPIGKGNAIKLNDGDKFSLGDYEFLVSAWNAEQADSNQGPFAGSSPVIAPQAIQETSLQPEEDYFASAKPSEIDSFAAPFGGHVAQADSLFSPEPLETDPLALLDNARHTPELNPFKSNSFAGLSQSDQADPMQESINWPTSTVESGAIPENWEEDLLASTAPLASMAPVAVTHSLNKSHFPIDERADNTGSHRCLNVQQSDSDKRNALEKANEKILAEIEILKKQAQKQALQEQITKNTTPKTSAIPPQVTQTRATTNNEQTLIQAMGLGGNNLSDEKIIEINQVVGELVKETVTGMMRVLSSRSTIKNEFRMNVTTIQPVENNPLKFSANVEDAIENMFVKDGNAYKKPIEAIKEGFEGIAEHQVAILAGIRSAFKGVLTRFDPIILEQRFEKFNKPGIIPGMSKAKNWESYKSYYQDLVDDMDNSFQHLFGYEFVQAYEEQLQKLSLARKTEN
ncbi:MAG: type VI secretion system-associated FHA domain protein TagH [Woeseiaceae bacterium]